ncbi:MAG: hypothetical protein JSU70_02410, partial [Phycisphaerales bacterium]
FVGLSWRLKRAERMQNQAIDVMMARDEPSPLSKQLTAALPRHLRAVREDPRGAGPELLLGRAATKDFTNYKVLGQLSMYERRIESSMFKTMAELQKLRLARELQETDASEQEIRPDRSSPHREEANPAKQSQFERAQMNVSLVSKEDYANRAALLPRQNKAKQSQLGRISRAAPLPASPRGRRRRSPVAL